MLRLHIILNQILMCFVSWAVFFCKAHKLLTSFERSVSLKEFGYKFCKFSLQSRILNALDIRQTKIVFADSNSNSNLNQDIVHTYNSAVSSLKIVLLCFFFFLLIFFSFILLFKWAGYGELIASIKFARKINKMNSV